MNNTMFSGYSDVITVDDLQSMLQIGRNAAYGLLQNGAIATIRVGKKYIIPKASVIEFLSLNHAAKPVIMSPSGKACEPRKEQINGNHGLCNNEKRQILCRAKSPR